MSVEFLKQLNTRMKKPNSTIIFVSKLQFGSSENFMTRNGFWISAAYEPM